jgi:peptidoglycan biosynthesis protein MviN/MurJ (putative lipid II flippase)
LTLIALTLAMGGVFKLSAFAREAFIAGKFGLSSVTDAYFGLQQLPITFATFMFGAFALAFTPAYSEARRRDRTVEWLPGLLVIGGLLGFILSTAMIVSGPGLFRLIHTEATPDIWSTLMILSACFMPIFCVGIWAGICTARGHNLSAMTVIGFPYLLMALTLFGLNLFGRLDNLSLPISMTAGFAAVGAYSLLRILLSQPLTSSISPFSIWKIDEFRTFLRQLSAATIENGGFAANQLLMIYFLSRSGVGTISGNNCAMRIGMIGYSVLAMPLMQLVQARLCATEGGARHRMFRRWFLMVAGVSTMFAAGVFLMRYPVIRAVYMHGKFQDTELRLVASLLPAWLAYVTVMSLNQLSAQYLFIRSIGPVYVRRQLYAYAAANLLRLAIVGRFDASWLIWCSVITEACAMLANLLNCLSSQVPNDVPSSLAAVNEVAG